MLSVNLSCFKNPSAKSASSAASVFQLENARLGNGQSRPAIIVRKVGSKYQTGKTGDFWGNCAETAASEKSARLLRKAESQMKRKAFVALSQFDRGLLLGRRAFLF
jgi:hypothetical protein